MTAPTSARAQRAKDIAALSRRCRGAMFSHNGDDLAAAIVAYVDTLAPDTERLGGGERATKDERDALKLIADTLTEVAPGWLIMSDAIRTLAQTAKDATARAEAAEAANMELDNARKSAEQSARDLRAENAQLRAQLDAMTGEQVPVIDVFCKNNVCMFGSSTFPSTLPDGVHTLYRHPTPAARVVGACVVGVLTAKTDEVTNCTSFHIDTSKYIPSKIVPPDGEYDIWIGAPLPTEGGK